MSQEHYVQIPPINFRNRSFTLEMWLLPYSAATIGSSADDFSIFCQCSAYNVCMSVNLRSGRVHLSFDSLANNATLISSTIVGLSQWTHVAIVYDLGVFQQRIYINGEISSTVPLKIKYIRDEKCSHYFRQCNTINKNLCRSTSQNSQNSSDACLKSQNCNKFVEIFIFIKI